MARFIISPVFLLGLLVIIFAGHVSSSVLWTQNSPYLVLLSALFHFAGGFWIASAFFYFLASRPHLFSAGHDWRISLFIGVSVVVLFGVGWEIFEFILDKYFIIEGISPYQKMELQDTIADLLFDIIGGFTASFFYLILAKRHHNDGR